jgi:hypothetical protein
VTKNTQSATSKQKWEQQQSTADKTLRSEQKLKDGTYGEKESTQPRYQQPTNHCHQQPHLAPSTYIPLHNTSKTYEIMHEPAHGITFPSILIFFHSLLYFLIDLNTNS